MIHKSKLLILKLLAEKLGHLWWFWWLVCLIQIWERYPTVLTIERLCFENFKFNLIYSFLPTCKLQTNRLFVYKKQNLKFKQRKGKLYFINVILQYYNCVYVCLCAKIPLPTGKIQFYFSSSISLFILSVCLCLLRHM